MHPGGHSTLFLWPDHWQVVGTLMANRPHRHISASWLVGLDGDFRLQVNGQWRTTCAALVAPDVEQSLDPGSTRMWCAQLDPDTRYWRRIRHHLQGQASVDVALPDSLISRIPLTSCADADGFLRSAMELLGEDEAVLDPRVQSVCDYLRAELPERLDVAGLAQGVGLSASRLSHLFRQQTGVPMRRFLLHIKMNRVLAQWELGKSLSRLATEAGFYDQPHFVRTARSMFDALPSEYVTTDWFRICRCGLFSSSP